MDLSENEDESISSSDEENEKLEARCEELEAEISVNKFSYDVHVELVNLYEKLTDLKSLRAAYERFHEVFPLTPELWLKWIKNEIKVATTEQEKQNIIELFDQAVEDYSSVELWLEYAKYIMDTSSIEATKKVLENAINSVGLHVTEGSLLWDFIREIELEKLSVAVKDSNNWKEQVVKVIAIFQRQLSVPLLNMENTYNEWKIWQESLPKDFKYNSEPIEWGYQKACKLLESYMPYETELLETKEEPETYNIYTNYIATVKDPSTIICLYERAVSQLCLNPVLWKDYCIYTFNLGEIALKTCSRSLRNCPWSEDLWIVKLRVLENLKKESEDVLTCFEQGLLSISPSPGLQLWFTYIEFLKRNSDDKNKFKKLLMQASKSVGEYDTYSTLDRFHARVLAKDGEMKDAVSIWNKIIAKPQNKGNLTVWLEFIGLLKQFSEANHIRSLYQRALLSCKEWDYYIAEEWLLFEREYGTLSTVLKCEEKCKTVNRQNQQIQEEISEDKKKIENQKRGKKRELESDIKVEIKRVKKEVQKMEIEPIEKKPIEKDPNITVFISNISPSTNEKDLAKMFPNAVNIELCRDRKNISKCFGYVQFGLEEEVITALARDRELLDGRPIFISNCKPDKNQRKPIFKYSSELEETKLFVRGLPKNLKKEDVTKIFEAYQPKDTRIVLHKTGQSKGLAYVDFPTAALAKQALNKIDQMKIGEHIISVALSAPPPKKNVDDINLEPTRHAKTRLQIPLIPRSVQTKTENSSSENGQKLPKSNDDFRKMFLKN